MFKALCKVAKAPIRRTNADHSELVTELLFGEAVEVLERQKNWARVRCLLDGYEGWMDFYQLVEKKSAGREEVIIEVANLKCEGKSGSMLLPMGSRLQKNDMRFLLEDQVISVQTEHTIDFDNRIEKLIGAAKQLLNTSYLWGGRSSFGIDCSGLVQVCHALIGIQLRRDASQQYEQGIAVNGVNMIKRGDLAFFKNPSNKIIHVGILLSKKQIIHASSWVRIDQFDEKGIFNTDRQTYTHSLAGIRRNVV